ncbi:carbon storage regulator [Pseudomonas cichorii JBC1]|uniref:Translational regulator CsrA n=1 Tax=Pseudomonas cichorii TaxID=36746 RepID=A0ABQ1DIL9_PSECI|nr:carbon storage regulator [Pseudomonas cichorii JBC1]QVE15717.1 carbon storage regulator CsrA [Pseudomonas cichorii]GFM90825.1 hypothetical protein PSCICP_07970 [Pseudomonas cichorii]SDN32427.1 carbon storage regulator, CsrA [Pseudomonas cichorii]
MLILTRKLGETLCIGEDITVTVIGVHGMQVRIGISAPKDVPVDREEIAIRKAGGAHKPVVAPTTDEPLYANRTEQEWRELLAAEKEAEQVSSRTEGGRHVSK